MDNITADTSRSTENIISAEDIERNKSPENQECEPTRGYIRFFALVLMCILGFGSYFCYDNPGALQDNFIKDMGLSTTQFTLLYSWYSWPNVVLCFVGGFLIDRVFGIKFGTILYAGIVVVGQLIFAYGAYTNSYFLTIAGRFVFGIGGESLAVAQNNYAVLWFMGKELNTVFGLQLSFARVGSTVNIDVMEPLYNWVANYYSGYQCLGIALFIATSTCIMSLFCAILLGTLKLKPQQNTSTSEEKVVRLTDLKDFNITFWLITVICIAYYVGIYPLIALGKVYFERKFGLKSQEAGYANSLLYFTSAAFSPISGFIIDKCGRNVFWVFFSILCTIVAHSMLAFTFINPYITMSVIGISYSMLAAALWPLVAFIIPQYQLGTAYGVAQSVQNLGLAVITMYAGIIVDNGGYLMLEIFFLCWLSLALLVSVLIWMYDASHTGVLNMSASKREEYEKERIIVEALEREKLLAASSMSDITPQDLLQPHSDFHIRNRYLSRIGASLPTHLVTYRPLR